ncbi:MAG: PspC domain-containing protein [Mycobacteriales bacterium]
MTEHDPPRGTPPGPPPSDEARPGPPDSAGAGRGAPPAAPPADGTGDGDRTEVLGAPAAGTTSSGDPSAGETSAGLPPAGGAGAPPWTWSPAAAPGAGGGGGYVPPGGPGGPPGGSTGPPGGPVPPPYPPIRRLQRSKERRVIAGVAGGLGEYTGVDPVLFRVLFAVLSVFGGAGILLYLLGWLFLPDADQPTSTVESLLGRGSGRRSRDIVQVVLLVIVGLILAGVLAHGDGGDVVLLLVVVGGVVLLVRNLDQRRGGLPSAPQPAPPPPTYQPYEPDPYPPYDPTRTLAMPAGPATVTAVQPPAAVPGAPVQERRERSILGRLTLSALLLVLGVTAALDAADVVAPQSRHYLALTVGVLGLGLLVGAWRGRARGLIWLGIPLTVALVAAGTAEVSLDGGAGDRHYRPQSIAEVQPDYRVGVGNLQLDLTDVDFTARSVSSSVSAGIGNVQVIVPRDVDVEVVGRAGIGESDLFGQQSDGGRSRERTVVDNGPDGEGGGSLRLMLDVGVGRVEVDRAAA